VIGERSLSCRWLQRTASALIEAVKRLNAPSASLFYGKGCGLWAAILVNGNHNHPPSFDPACHCAIRNVYKGEQFKETVEAHRKTGLLSRHTLNVFEFEDPSIPLIKRDIYNQQAASRRQELNGRSPLETLLGVTGGDFNQWHVNESGDSSGHLSRLFIAYKPNRQLIAHNSEVVIVHLQDKYVQDACQLYWRHSEQYAFPHGLCIHTPPRPWRSITLLSVL
jgi:hypothetical protein